MNWLLGLLGFEKPKKGVYGDSDRGYLVYDGKGAIVNKQGKVRHFTTYKAAKKAAKKSKAW